MSISFINALSVSVTVVLIKTSHSGNIGAVARAMKNMGLCKLRPVEPKNFPSDESTRRSSGAENILNSAEVFGSMDEAINDCHFVVGASARSRSLAWPLFNPRECATKVLSLIASQSALVVNGTEQLAEPVRKVALVFGQEASGLTNEELQRCNYHVNIPANPEYASLNLAMAVQVIAYELRMAALLEEESDLLSGTECAGAEEWEGELASVGEVEGLLQHTEATAIKLGFLNPAKPGMLMPRLRRLYQRAALDKMEVNILRGILKATLNQIGK